MAPPFQLALKPGSTTEVLRPPTAISVYDFPACPINQRTQVGDSFKYPVARVSSGNLSTLPPLALLSMLQVRLRPTPVKDGDRRQTISSFEPGRPQPTPARAASYMGMVTPSSTLYGRSRDDIDIMRSTGGPGAMAGAGKGADGDDAAGVFRPGVGSVEGGSGKRRRGH